MRRSALLGISAETVVLRCELCARSWITRSTIFSRSKSHPPGGRTLTGRRRHAILGIVSGHADGRDRAVWPRD